MLRIQTYSVILLSIIVALSETTLIQHEWTLRYVKYNPDGVYRVVIGIYDKDGNFHFPGPTIRAQKDDTIQVIVHNDLPTETTSIHWHGIHQLNTPWMDGISYTTQYPILPMQRFNYTFKAEPVGTHWYHSHTGAQYADGLYGALIVEDPQDPYADIPELTLTMAEWWHKYAIDQFDILASNPNKHHHSFPRLLSGIMNGKGRYNCSLFEPNMDWLSVSIEEQNELGDKFMCTPNHPYERFTVTFNRTYRFRLITAASEFNYKFSIDNHYLTVIAIDGVYVEPYTVQQIWIYIGQRYDVLVTMNDVLGSGVHLIRAVITDHDDEQFYAILQYNNTADQHNEPTTISTKQMEKTFLLNSMPLVPTSTNTHFSLKPPSFNETHILHVICAPTAHRCSVNSINYKMPHEPTLYTLYKNESQVNALPNMINLKQNDHVMIVLNNFHDFGHSFHLHGHSFYVLAVGNRSMLPHNEPIMFDPLRDRHKLNLVNPPYRDTEQLPELSYMVIGFVANNPGSWLFHCHLAWDMEAGMVAVFNVASDRIPPPPADYPIITGFQSKTA